MKTDRKKEEKIALKALLLLIFSFLEKSAKEGMLGLNKECEYIEGKENMNLLFFVFKKMKKLSPNFARKNVHKFLIKKIGYDNIQTYEINFVTIAVMLLYIYRISDLKKEIIPLSVQEARKLLQSVRNDIGEDEKILAKKIFTAFFPDYEGFIDFLYLKYKI